MPAFDVTASPSQLTLKAGETGIIVVTVTNQLGRAVVARADKAVTPASAAGWVKAPANAQRSFSPDKSTEEFRYEVAIPAGTAATSLTIQFDVVDIDHMEDNFGQSNVVAVTVPATALPPPPPNGKIPVWVWPVAAIVLIGVGIGVWLMLRDGGGGMPNVIGQSFEDAKQTLEQQSMVVLRTDSLSSAADTANYERGTVMAQWPLPDSALKGDKDIPDTARLVVQKDFTVVPAGLVRGDPVNAASQLGLAGLFTKPGTKRVGTEAEGGKVAGTIPDGGTLLARGDTVTLQVGFFCKTMIACLGGIRPDVLRGIAGVQVKTKTP